jgi:hypothetical protein
MKRIRIIGLVLAAVFALSAVASATASAEENPTWWYCKKVGGTLGKFTTSACTGTEAPGEWEKTFLAAGEFKEITAAANGTQKLSSTGVTINCTALKLGAGAKLLGGEPGTDEEIITYEKCSVEGFPLCKINGKNAGEATITTNLLKSTLVFETKAAAEAKTAPTLSLFEPKVGTQFVEIEFSGTCPATGKLKVLGKVLAKNVNGESHIETGELEAPPTAIKKYFTNPGATEHKFSATEELHLEGIFNLPATYSGKATVKLKETGFDWWIKN